MLAREKIAVRVVDRNPAPVAESRALIIHHHTLDLLRETGVSDKLIAHGNAIRGVKLTVHGRPKATARFDFFPHPFKALLAVPQGIAERVLLDAFRQLGGSVERNTEFIAAKMESTGGDVELRTGEAREKTRVSWLIGADGLQSDVRRALDIATPGATPEFRWSLADLDLGGEADNDLMEICLASGAPALIRIPLGRGRHRVMTGTSGVLDLLPDHWEPGEVAWQQEIVTSHRMVDRRMIGRAALIGEAAHRHSPLSMRGLNLGIEDAITLARLIRDTSSVSPSMLSKEMEEQIKIRFRGWERERQNRARAALAVSDRLQAVAAQSSGFERLKFGFALRFIRHLPSAQRALVAMLTEMRAT